MVTVGEIQGYKLFSGLEEKDLVPIAEICNRRVYETNTIIFSPDNPANEIFILEEGNESVQIEIPIEDNEEKIVIHTLSKGETFGWAPLSEHHTRTAVARCVSQARIISIDGTLLTKLLEADNHTGYIVMRNLTKIISTRLAYTTVAFRYEIRKIRKKIKG